MSDKVNHMLNFNLMRFDMKITSIRVGNEYR